MSEICEASDIDQGLSVFERVIIRVKVRFDGFSRLFHKHRHVIFGQSLCYYGFCDGDTHTSRAESDFLFGQDAECPVRSNW